MKIRNRRMLASGLTAASLAAVVGGVAAAQSTSTPPADTQTAGTQTGQAGEGAAGNETEEQDPALNGSVQITDNESGSEADEATQIAQIDGLVSEQDAIAAATANGGSADTAELGNENGTVVWEVVVTNDDGTVEEVKVDAGNGDVLAREADENEADENEADENEADENEADEGSEAEDGSNG